MVSKILSAIPVGVSAEIVEVEADVSNGLPATVIVGLPDTAVMESRERVKSAIKNSGGKYPQSRVSVNLAPADVPKNGSHFDLPIALSILKAAGDIDFKSEQKLFVGELSLDGTLRSVPGILAVAIRAQEEGVTEIFVPEDNAREAAGVEGLRVFAFKTLSDVVRHLSGLVVREVFIRPDYENAELHEFSVKIEDIAGHFLPKQALMVAAAGGHNILLFGPPGSGKTMLAKAFHSLLPELTFSESLEVSKIYSAIGLLGTDLIRKRPFRNPHHTTSAPAVIGGGPYARPGEITLAHKGVLFLDEFPEFPRNVLEALRQPLEDGQIVVSRVKAFYKYPARFILVAAQNPCPCGFYGDTDKPCVCPPGAVARYERKVSGPLLDRIDIKIVVKRVSPSDLHSRANTSETSELVRNKVRVARSIQEKRLGPGRTNAEMSSKEVQEFCILGESEKELMEQITNARSLSPRQYMRLLKVARTIADLENLENISKGHIAQAAQFNNAESSIVV